MFDAASVPQLILAAARDPALRVREAIWAGGRTITHGDLADAIAAMAGLLLARGLSRGERVGVLAGRTIEGMSSVLGVMAAGGAAFVLDPRLTAADAQNRLASAGARWLLADEAHADLAAAAMPQSVIRLEDARAHRRRTVTDLTPEDDALLVSTSGSTSVPKAVLLTHRNLLSNTWGVVERTGLAPDDRVLHMLPMHHTNGVNNLLIVPLASGAAVVMLDHFRAESFFDAVAALRPTYVTGVATHYSRLLAHRPPRGALASLRFLRSGAAPMPPALHREIERHFDLPLIHSYGLSEDTCTATMNPPAARRIGTVGTALDGQQVAIFSPGGETPLPAGAEGEICIAGPSLMKGYIPAVNAQDGPTVRRGWLRTADLGHLDGDGYLTVTGRLKELIIRGGENLSPGRIEDAILRHPGVRGCCVVGAPDRDLGEIPVAFVVARDGGAVAEKAIREHVAAELPRSYVPARVIMLDALPEIGIGKIDRQALRRLAEKA